MTRRILLAAFGLALMACRTQKAEFCNKVFECDLYAAENPCGKSCAGNPMTCYAASQLGGTDFCAEACDPAQGSGDPAFTCMTSGALLQLCHPHAAMTDPSMGCPDGLQCYRTDLFKDEGVCVALHVCTTNDDCAGGRRHICAATILRELYGVPADNLQCLQPTCTSSVTQCLSGESCLASYYEVGPTSDICVPNCDKGHCPPNFSCVSVTSGAGSPPICVPGVPGARCVSDQDCLIGSCVDTGAGFSECVPPIPCSSNLDCAPFDSTTSVYACVKTSPTGPGVCFSTNPFRGANCNETVASPQGHCSEGRTCYRYSPYNPGETSGECRVPCDGDKKCPVIGGIPHTCLNDGAGGCYPTGFAMPCDTSADCFAELACQAVSPDERTVITSPAICTLACETDADCRKHPMILTTGFCKEGFCRLGGMAGNNCERDEQCREGVCSLDADGQRRCRI